MNILFANNDDKKKEIYELGFKLNDKNAKCISLEEAGLKKKFKFELSNNDVDAAVCSKDCDYLTVSVKESLYIDGLSDDEQPGENFRVIKSKTSDGNDINLNEAQVANYYSNIVKRLGGSAKAKWIDKVTIAKDGKVLKSFNIENEAILTSKISRNIDKFNPINSITIIPEFGDIHYSDCNIEEAKFLYEIKDKKVLNDISNAIKEIKGEMK